MSRHAPGSCRRVQLGLVAAELAELIPGSPLNGRRGICRPGRSLKRLAAAAPVLGVLQPQVRS